VFLLGLSVVDAEARRNLELLKERGWFDIAVVYGKGRRAIIAVEKGDPGERAFREAFKTWEQGKIYPVHVVSQRTEPTRWRRIAHCRPSIRLCSGPVARSSSAPTSARRAYISALRLDLRIGRGSRRDVLQPHGGGRPVRRPMDGRRALKEVRSHRSQWPSGVRGSAERFTDAICNPRAARISRAGQRRT
jgi:hypothetical protein